MNGALSFDPEHRRVRHFATSRTLPQQWRQWLKGKQAFRSLLARARLWRAEATVFAFTGRRGRPHGLGREVVLSLTSYPARFAVVSKTLKSLLVQRVKPDRVVLWIAEDDLALLPHAVLRLQKFGLDIRSCAELGSYKKIVPSLRAFPNAYVVTADDDLYYASDWLEQLLSGVVEGENVVVCRRAHCPKRDASGFAPYLDWQWDVVTAGEIRDDLFPTGGAGAVYPSGCLPRETTDERTFLTMCPTADDVWLYCMGRRAGLRYRQVGGGFAQISWPGSQVSSLVQQNVGQRGNDEQLALVWKEFVAGGGAHAS